MVKNISEHAELYNSLTDVEYADEQLSAVNKSAVLERLCDIILKYHLENVIGIRLIHNHNEISMGELMLETLEIDQKGGKSLATIATHTAAIAKRAAANSWILKDEGFEPLEFSDDPMVVSEAGILESKGNFFVEFAAALKELNIEHILGPCIVRRQFFADNRPVTPSLLVETSDIERRANILRFDDELKYPPEKIIQTSWLAERKSAEIDSSACTQACERSACVPHSVCVRERDGHVNRRHHDQGRHTRWHRQ